MEHVPGGQGDLKTRSLDASEYQSLAIDYVRLSKKVEMMVEARRRHIAMVQQVIDCFNDLVNDYTVEDPESGLPFFLRDPDPLSVKIMAHTAALQSLMEHWIAQTEVEWARIGELVSS